MPPVNPNPNYGQMSFEEKLRHFQSLGRRNSRMPRGNPPPQTVNKRHPGGMAGFYDDSYGIILQGLQGGSSVGGIYKDLLEGFKGAPGDLESFMERVGPFIAMGLEGGEGYKYLQDPKNWDMGAMASYGPAAGMMGKMGRQGMRTGQNQLAQMGLGGSAARASLAQQATQQTGTNQANLWSQLFQQSQQNKMQNATRAYDVNREIAQLALGQTPTPRLYGGGGSSISGLGALGGGIGGLLEGISSFF